MSNKSSTDITFEVNSADAEVRFSKDKTDFTLTLQEDSRPEAEDDIGHNEEEDITPMVCPIPGGLRAFFGRIVEHPLTTIGIALLVTLDLVILLIEELTSEEDGPDRKLLHDITLGLLIALCVEVTIRLLYLDIFKFMSDVWNIFDFVISYLSIAVMDVGRWLVIARFMRMGRIVVLAYRAKRKMTITKNRLKSQTRRRYQKNGFNLDLTYITDRVIGMGSPIKPSSNDHARQPIAQLIKFFNHTHQDAYRLYNVDPDKLYKYWQFNNQVIEYMIHKGQPGPLHQLVRSAEDITWFIRKDPRNVCAVHDKQGQARTGLLIACYMLYAGIFDDAEQASQYWVLRRTKPGTSSKPNAIKAASQQRYLKYFETICKQPRPIQIPVKQRFLKSVVINGCSSINGFNKMYLVVRFEGKKVLLNQRLEDKNPDDTYKETFSVKDGDKSTWTPSREIRLNGDIQILFHVFGASEPVLSFWFNTGMEEKSPTTFGADEIDFPKNKNPKSSSGCSVELHYGDGANVEASIRNRKQSTTGHALLDD